MKNTLALGTLAVALCLSVNASAGDQDFILNNATGYTIDEVRLAPTGTDEWSKDVLGKDTLGDGESWKINFAHSAEACKWDLKVVYTDDASKVTWQDLNLCKINKITLHWSQKTGVSSADVE
jgi:hypothetical protein